jgi:hypothetical protein
MAIAAPMVTRERILQVLAASSAAASLAVAASQIAANARWVAAVKVAAIVGNGSHGLGTAELLSLWAFRPFARVVRPPYPGGKKPLRADDRTPQLRARAP